MSRCKGNAIIHCVEIETKLIVLTKSVCCDSWCQLLTRRNEGHPKITGWHNWSYCQQASQRRRQQFSYVGFSPDHDSSGSNKNLWQKAKIPGPAPCQPLPTVSLQRLVGLQHWVVYFPCGIEYKRSFASGPKLWFLLHTNQLSQVQVQMFNTSWTYCQMAVVLR